jgi:hypothetical protein
MSIRFLYTNPFWRVKVTDHEIFETGDGTRIFVCDEATGTYAKVDKDIRDEFNL